MAEVDHHPYPIHLLYDLCSEGAHTSVLVVASGGVADVVVTVVAERHVDYSSSAEGFNIGDVFAYGIAVFYAHHDALLPCCFESADVIGGVGNIDRCAVGCRHLFYLCEYLVCLGSGTE